MRHLLEGGAYFDLICCLVKELIERVIEVINNEMKLRDNEILGPLEESRNFSKTTSNAIIDMQAPTLQKSLSSENL